MRPVLSRCLCLSAVLLAPAAICAELPTGHHGGVIIHCTDPRFYQESPGNDARVERLERFTFTASDNTAPDSLEVVVNLKPVQLTVTRQRSGLYQVEAVLPEPVTAGRAWIRVMGTSEDGCHELHAWNVYVGP